MNLKKTFSYLIRVVLLFIVPLVPLRSQEKSEDASPVKAELYKAKEDALNYLSDNRIVSKFGVISDSIWTFAELGMQEFRSSALLIRTLEAEGFTVKKGLAGMPTCFVASWGSGKPLIGLLGEFDALPMLSQKALSPKQDPVIKGEIGRASCRERV